MQCQICGTKIAKDEVFTYGDKLLCEDCYIEMISTPKACNPMAVRSARLTRENWVIRGQRACCRFKNRFTNTSANKEIPREEEQ